MTVHRVDEAPNIVLREDCVGCATTAICYPGISSCITITCVSPSRLVGAHITIGTTAEEVDEMFQYIKVNTANIYAYYVVGSIDRFKPNARCTEIDTRKKLEERLKKEFNPKGSVGFYDTTPDDVHIFAVKARLNITFSRIAAAGNMVAGNNYLDFPGRTIINEDQFVVL